MTIITPPVPQAIGTFNDDKWRDAIARALDMACPVGEITLYGGSAAPDGWLLCNGAAVSRTTYKKLYKKISTTYGSGDGSTTFNVPDLRQRFPMGKAASGTGSTLGGTGGTVDHTHSAPAHYHGMGTGADLNVTSSGNGTSGTGSAHAHFCANSNTAGSTLDSNGVINVSKDHTNDFSYTLQGTSTAASIGTSSTESSHTHTTPAHTHAAGNIAGSIGLKTGGVDGNAAMTSGTGNPPYQVVNYIIRY